MINAVWEAGQPLTGPSEACDGLLSPVAKTSGTIADLTNLMARGNEDAFRRFHQTYFDRLFRYVLVMHYGDENAALDTLQETFVRVARHCRIFHDENEFWKWLTVLARSAARDQGRRRQRYLDALRRFFRVAPRDEAERADVLPDAESRIRELLDQGLAALPEQDRELIEGKYFDRHSIAELAAAHQLTVKAVESRLHRGRQQLRRWIQKGLTHE